MKYNVVIGLEIHVQMKTKTKMFSCAPVTHGEEPNTKVDYYDFAFPGVMPRPNKQVVINAIRVCHALHMEIDHILMFDRKNYFYSDLPKGYQITQAFRPIGRDGFIILNNKKIGIERLHIEEDASKQVHYKDYTLLDYNRAGIPLIEIVTTPDISSGEEAAKFIENLRRIVSFLGVSDAKMERGSLRCDINVSLNNKEDNRAGTKVEIKNVNTLTGIKQAIDYEIKRQSEILDKGQKVKQETRRFSEDSKTTILMRKKENAIDYKYFFDPNIPPISLSEEFILDAINNAPESYESYKNRYLSLGLNEKDISILLSSKEFADYFEMVIKDCSNYKMVANWMNGEVLSYLNKQKMDIFDFNLKPSNLAKLINLVIDDVISIKQAKEIFAIIINSDSDPVSIMKRLGYSQNSDKEELIKIINEVLDDHLDLVEDYKNGKDRLVEFFIGQIMKITKGRANPSLTNKLLLEELKRR